MTYRITCPYCFEQMDDDEVCFRSERVNTGACELIPDDYDDLGDFVRNYHGNDKGRILNKFKEWEFFAEKEDLPYDDFWKKYNGTTEGEGSRTVSPIREYRRQVIDPSNTYHQSYLKKQPDGGYLIRDGDGMVSMVELTSGECCSRRVCPHCHNPLPDGYGKAPTRFVAVIGITGSGKTVYLSQLLKGMEHYATNVGMSASESSDSVQNFISGNPIVVGRPLPGSTPSQRLQQPLFYRLERATADGHKATDTLVLYDVAGEVLMDSHLIRNYAPFISHADGLLLLIDPMQFEGVRMGVRDSQELDNPTKALDTIHGIVAGSVDKKCDIPCAVCVSKVDELFKLDGDRQGVLGYRLRELLQQEIVQGRGTNGYAAQVFNARQYSETARELERRLQDLSPELVQKIMSNYSAYAYFALTSLGCDVKTRNDAGIEYQYPEGPLMPKHVEDPLQWLFYRFGYIRANDRVYPEMLACPECGSTELEELPEGSYTTRKVGLFKAEKEGVNRRCLACGHQWWYDPENAA